MDWSFWIIGFALLFLVATAWSLYGRSRTQTGIGSHPIEEQSGAPAAGEPRDDA